MNKALNLRSAEVTSDHVDAPAKYTGARLLAAANETTFVRDAHLEVDFSKRAPAAAILGLTESAILVKKRPEFTASAANEAKFEL